MRLAVVPPPAQRRRAMAPIATGLQAALLDVGLWAQPLIQWVEAQGLETVDDLRCYLRSQDAADEAGPMVGLVWSLCCDKLASDRSLRVVQCRLEFAEEARRMGRALSRPSLPAPRRAGKPRKQPEVVDPGSDLAARRKSAAVAVQLSFSRHPNWGLASRAGKLPPKLLDA